jgi:YVTN family beta-propeller protein
LTTDTEIVDIVIAPDGNKAYASGNDSAKVEVIDLATRTVTNIIALSAGADPWGIAIEPTGKYVYVSAAGSIEKIDTDTNLVVESIPVTGNTEDSLAVNNAGTYAYVTQYRGSIVTILKLDPINDDSESWVGAQSITCSAPNPWVKEQLGFATNAKPVFVSAENTVGKTITQSSYDSLKSSGVVFDTVSTKVSTATETLPIYGCKDKLLSGKVNQPIQFIAGGYTLQSDAHGYINTADLKWHDTNGVTLYTNTAAFMHTIKFTKTGKYVVVLTEQPDTSRGLIPTYGVRSIRFVININ